VRALGPVSRSTTTSDLVVAAIRAAILEGRLAPGETLVERRLAEQLRVSKTPVREAFIALAAAGLVTVTPNRGTVVRAVDVEQIRQAYEVRTLIEPWAGGRTVRRAGPAAADQARTALAEARSRLAGIGRAGSSPGGGRPAGEVPLSLANRKFHRALYAGCGNDLVIAQLDGVQELAALGAVALLWPDRPSWREEYEEHREILAAVAEGAADRAERLVRKHIRESLRRLNAAS
jgi:DNA-binding GntR family transcriptional regulator